MSRSLPIVFLVSLLPSVLFAQVEVGISGGIHIDRAPVPDRLVAERGAAMYAEPGEASALGIHVGYWRSPKLGIQLDLSRSSSASWSGTTPLPPPPFANRTTYLSVRAVTRTAPDKRVQFAVAAGPALLIYGGTGTNLRTRGADLGAVLEGSARLRLTPQLAFRLAASNYFYRSRYRPDPLEGGPAGATRRVFRHDLLLLPGLVYFWR